MNALRRGAAAAAAVLASLVLAAPAFACATDATSWFETFLDSSCLPTKTATETDPLGGLRLVPNGTPVQQTWDTAADFTSPTSVFNSPIGISTLAVTSGGDGLNGDDPGALELPPTTLPLDRDANSLLAPATPANLDSESVDDPSVLKVNGQYLMYYAGYAEDGSGPRIFRATSANGTNWTNRSLVLDGDTTPGSFDDRGVHGPEVVFDPAAAPANRYKMWYSARGDVFNTIGFAASPDGITFTAQATPAVDHGRPGSPDSFSASDPTVIKDNGIWKMWYTGDDSNIKRIAYATSTDNLTWKKGGRVIDASGGNTEFGAFAPSVWKDGDTYNIRFVGRKDVGTALVPDFQTKIIGGSSQDGIEWSSFNIALNTGAAAPFANENLSSPDVLVEGNSTTLFYSGNTVDGGPMRIGRVGSTAPMIDLGAPGARFDARRTSGVSAVRVTAVAVGEDEFQGAYEGRNSDGRPRIGLAKSADGSAWTPVDGSQTNKQILADGGNNQFDEDGQLDPNLEFEGGNYHLFFTGDNDGVESIGHVTTAQAVGTNQPAAWPDPTTASNQILTASGTGGSFDETDVSDPYVVKDLNDDAVTPEATDEWAMYYVGTNAAGKPSIGRVVSNTAPGSGYSIGRAQVLAGAAGTFEKDGIKNPVVWQEDATHWHMLYTGIEKFDEDGDGVIDQTIERVGHATTDDPSTGTWTRDASGPFTLGPSQTPYGPDESGAEPTGGFLDGTTTHVWYSGIDRTGRTRGLHATFDSATPPPMFVPNGYATYQFGDNTTSARDFKQLIRDTDVDDNVDLWMSVLQPYSPLAGKDYWSDYFPVVVGTTDTTNLDLLLTIKGIRWQARVRRSASASPILDKVVLAHAPVEFSATGSARTTPIDGPVGQDITSWQNLEVQTKLSGTGTATGTVEVRNASSDALVKTAPLTIGTTTNASSTTIDLKDVPVADNPSLRLVFLLNSAGPGHTASPLITFAQLSYFTNASQPGITLTAAPTTVDSGGAVTLSGDVTQGGTPFAGATVQLLQQPGGGGTFTQFATVTTDNAGHYSTTVNPTATTNYEASTSGVTSAPVTVTVNQPPKVDLTLTATPAEVIFGQPVALAGHASQAGVAVPNLAVSLLANNSPFTTATTNATGDYSATNTPQANTVYSATVPNGANTPTANVGVHQLLTLKAARRLGTATFKGAIAPAHPGRDVVIQLKKGTSFVTFAKAKTTSTSTYSVKKKLKVCGKFQFRAVTAADADHLDGTSVIALVEKHRITLKVSVKGKTVTFVGKVAPKHKSGSLLIQVKKGTKFAKLAKVKLTKKSTFKLVKKMKKGRYTFRASKPSDKCHFAGKSALRKARVR